MFKRKNREASSRVGKFSDKRCYPDQIYHDSRDNLFIHIHLPKTGGTAFNAVLDRIFGDAYEPFQGRFVHLYPKLSLDQVEAFMDKHPGIKAVSSHNFTAVLPYQNPHKRIVALAFIRNPVDMFFSYYFHMRNRPAVKCLEKELSLDEYLNYKAELAEKNRKGYLSHFTHGEKHNDFSYVTDLVQNKHLYLFPSDQMEKAVSKLTEWFPSDFSMVEVTRENSSKKDQEVTHSMKEFVGNRIVALHDFQLYELARQTLRNE